MGYLIACGNEYLQRTKNSSFLITTNRQLAYVNKTEAAAKNVIRNLKKSLQNRAWKVVSEDEDMRKNPLGLSESKYTQLSSDLEAVMAGESLTAVFEHEFLDSIYKDIISLSERLSDLQSKKSRVEILLKGTDLATIDLLHELELNNFSAVQGYQMSKKLKQIRKVRRDCKDQLLLLSILEELNLQELTNGGLKDKLTEIENRIYNSRILSGNFDKAEEIVHEAPKNYTNSF